MPKEDLLYIEDEHKRKLFYRFTPAAIASAFVPLVVVLHDQGSTALPNFEYKMWNILTPLDTFGYENKGSGWLGEDGDFFVKDLLQELIHQIADTHECEDHIYLYGSGMGGFGAILHGVLCKANAVYAQAPRIILQEPSDADFSLKQFYACIFSDRASKENDLRNFLNPTDNFPIFYLCDDKDFPQSCLADQAALFVAACKKHDIKYHLDFCPKSGDDETHALKEVLDGFERMTP